MTETTSLYIHIPFCQHRCAYCDFNTYAGQMDSIPGYVRALCKEIEIVGKTGNSPQIGTIFFGGGTPSLLSIDHYIEIFKNINQYFTVASGAEVSLEANPGTVAFEYLKELRKVGFNRISFGFQSANPEELRMLERIHTYPEAVNAIKWSRQAGFDNLNIDLIYGLPGQNLERWQKTVELVANLNPEHLSAYALTLEHGTPFGRWAAKGLLPIPDADTAADQYEWLMDFLAQKGFMQYEISNWAKPEKECRHNLQYWRNLNYLGLGAGAHGYVDGIRYSNVLRIKTYIDRLDGRIDHESSYPVSAAVVNQVQNNSRVDMQETMMTGLRLTTEGVSAATFQKRFGHELQNIYGKEIEYLLRVDLLEWVGDCLRLTIRGRLLGNQVFMQFVGE